MPWQFWWKPNTAKYFPFQHECRARLNSEKTLPDPFETYLHLMSIHLPLHKKAPYCYLSATPPGSASAPLPSVYSCFSLNSYSPNNTLKLNCFWVCSWDPWLLVLPVRLRTHLHTTHRRSSLFFFNFNGSSWQSHAEQLVCSSRISWYAN